MAVLDHGTITVGELVQLWPPNETFWQVDVVLPDGQEMRVRRPAGQPARFVTFLAGEWTYRWPDGELGSLNVVQDPPAEPVARQGRWV